MSWNYRLFKDTIKDDLGRECERISIATVYYDEQGAIKARGDINFSFDQFGELNVPDDEETFVINQLPYLPVDEEEAVKSITFTANKILEAATKPILTEKDFEHLNSVYKGSDDGL